MSSATKENLPIEPGRRTALLPAAIIGDERNDDEERPVMLSPPPEEELRIRRMNNEPGSASKPLATSGRPNQLKDLSLSPVGESGKRKRTFRSRETPPRPTRESQEHLKKQQQSYTPNPRLRKQVRHADLSPTIGAFSDIPQPPAPGSGSPRPSGPSSSARKTLLQEHTDANMTSPTRKAKGKSRMLDLLTAIHSPHAANPTADYIPSSRLAVKPDGNVSVRRRSVTPIPPYEPPAERFTPPREIMSTPVHAEKKSTRRPTAAAKKRTEPRVPLPTRIKTEPPEIDLTAPPPPASPSEDPILLVGSPPAPKAKRPSSLSFVASTAKDLVEFEMELDLPVDEFRGKSAAAGPSAISTPRMDSSFTSPIPSAFDFTNLNEDDFGANDLGSGPSDDVWSDSDSDEDEVVEGEGDYTGKFLSFKIPLKMDPPTSATRHRMEEWGRPISPHPKKFSLTDDEDDEDDETEPSLDNEDKEKRVTENDNVGASQIDEDPQMHQLSEHNEEQTAEIQRESDALPSYQDRRGRRLTLSELEARKFGSPNEGGLQERSPAELSDSGEQEIEPGLGEENEGQRKEQISADDTDAEEHDDDVLNDQSMGVEDTVEHQSPFDASGDLGAGKDVQENDEVHHIGSDITEPDVQDAPALSQTETLVDRLEPEQSFGRSLFSNERLSAPFNSSSPRESSEDSQRLRDDQTTVGEDLSAASQELVEQEGSSESDTEEVTDLGVVKIVSNDPMAAARAAAILKMHDYDMIARRLRRKSMAGAGVHKGYGTPKRAELWRRRTIAGLAAEDSLSANVTLPELVQKAEEELRSTPAHSRAGSVSVAGTPKKTVEESYVRQQDVWGPREWTKADWKILDSCFTDERYHLARSQGLPKGVLASVDDVESQKVVERFIVILGSGLTDSHGPSWTTDKLLQRVQALRKRQRDGHGAPPTPVVTSRHGLIASPSSSMIVPDFTPTPAERIRRFRYPGLPSDTATSTPNSSDRLFKSPLPPSLSRNGSSSLKEALSLLANESQELGGSSVAGLSTSSRASTPESTATGDDASETSESLDVLSTPVRNHLRRQPQTPMSAVKRSLNYIGSWLRPGMFKSKEEQRAASLPGLPVPPADVFAKPRGPVATPSKKPAPKAAHPKEQVTLQPAPAPQQPSKIPRVAKRLVDLQHVPTPPPKPLIERTISRRSSGSSVRDLVKDFEEMEKSKVKPVPPRVAELRRMGSLDTLKGKTGQKPAWKP